MKKITLLFLLLILSSCTIYDYPGEHHYQCKFESVDSYIPHFEETKEVQTEEAFTYLSEENIYSHDDYIYKSVYTIKFNKDDNPNVIEFYKTHDLKEFISRFNLLYQYKMEELEVIEDELHLTIIHTKHSEKRKKGWRGIIPPPEKAISNIIESLNSVNCEFIN